MVMVPLPLKGVHAILVCLCLFVFVWLVVSPLVCFSFPHSFQSLQGGIFSHWHSRARYCKPRRKLHPRNIFLQSWKLWSLPGIATGSRRTVWSASARWRTSRRMRVTTSSSAASQVPPQGCSVGQSALRRLGSQLAPPAASWLRRQQAPPYTASEGRGAPSSSRFPFSSHPGGSWHACWYSAATIRQLQQRQFPDYVVAVRKVRSARASAVCFAVWAAPWTRRAPSACSHRALCLLSLRCDMSPSHTIGHYRG